MEKFESAKGQTKDQKDDLLKKTREVFSLMVSQARDLKEQGEHYNPNLAQINPESINKEEAELWEEMEAMRTKEDYEKISQKFSAYRNKFKTASEKEKVGHTDFVAYLGNMIMAQAENRGILE